MIRTAGIEVETAFPTVSFDSYIPLEIDNQEVRTREMLHLRIEL